MQMREMTAVKQFKLPVGKLCIDAVSADIDIHIGTGPDITIAAATPACWEVTDDGHIKEVGGAVVEALKEASAGSKFSFTGASGSQYNFVSGEIDGVLYVNNRPLHPPDPLEKLEITLPPSFDTMLAIDMGYFGTVNVSAELRGKLLAKVSRKAVLNLSDQSSMKVCDLEASAGGQIAVKKLSLTEGSIKLQVASSGRLTFEALRGESLSAVASSQGSIEGKNARCEAVNCEVSSGGKMQLGHLSGRSVSLIVSTSSRAVVESISAKYKVQVANSTSSTAHIGDVWAAGLDVNASTSSVLKIGNADCAELKVSATMSADVTVGTGSAQTGSACATMSAGVRLAGEFAGVRKSESMSGSVTISRQNGDAADRFRRAAKRGFYSEFWEEPGTAVFAYAAAEQMVPAMQQEMAEALADATFVDVVCKAFKPAYADEAVVAAFRSCGSALMELVTLDDLADKDKERLVAALQSPVVQERYGNAFQLFLQTLFSRAQETMK